jgi:hypothetical protein
MALSVKLWVRMIMSDQQGVLNGIYKAFQNREYGKMIPYKDFKCAYIYVY